MTEPQDRLLNRLFYSYHNYFFLTVVFVIISGVCQALSDGDLETKILAIVLFSFPSLIHFFIWMKLLKNQKDNAFCNFFDFTMALSVASFSFPHILYTVPYFRHSIWWWGFGFLITVIFLIVLFLMILYVNFELVHKEVPAVPHQNNDTSQRHWKIIIKKYRDDPFKTKGLKAEIVNFPFWRVLHFFAIFISITYVFSFLMAFYDFGTGEGYIGSERGFYFEKVIADKKMISPSLSPSLSLNQNIQKDAAANKSDVPKSEVQNINSSTGKVENSDSLTSIQSTSDQPENPEIKMPICFYFDSGKTAISVDAVKINENILAPTDSKETEFFIKTTNDKSMNNLLRFLNDIDGKNNKVVIFELHGYADPNSIEANSKSYSSNYELSEARIIAIQSLILKTIRNQNQNVLRSKPVEWILFPHSDEKVGSQCKEYIEYQSNLDNLLPYTKENLPKLLNPKENFPKFFRVVEVFVKEVDNQQVANISDIKETLNKANSQLDNVNNRNEIIERNVEKIVDNTNNLNNNASIDKERTPTVLDYLYLSIGAITTNAAGDIKPATPAARFLISLISLFQIFFLVGFFNTLISLQEKTSKNEQTDPINFFQIFMIVRFFNTTLLSLQEKISKDETTDSAASPDDAYKPD